MTLQLPGLLSVFVVAGLVSGPAVVSAQTPAALPLGKSASGQVTSKASTTYRFDASTPGVLSVALNADADVTLTVTDADGQALPEGSSDQDLFGSTGNEQVMVTLREAGQYRVVVRLLDGGTSRFDIGAAWIAMPSWASTVSDPDRRPSLARPLEVGRSHEDALDADGGDNWDWFVITPKTSGTLTVILRATNDESPDLALELFTDDDLARASVRSDDDLQGRNTNESATVDVKAGQKVLVKVSGATSRPEGPYRIASSLIE
jgi:hypothetical protein